jgi:hypothetical protein
MTTKTRKRPRSLGRLDAETGLLVFEGHVRLSDLALACGSNLSTVLTRLAEHGIEAAPKPGLPAGRWLTLADAERFLSETQTRRKARR